MAHLTGIFRFTGTVAGLTVDRHGIVRRARSSNKEKFAHAPSMAGTRRNAHEFGQASRAGRLLRHALYPHLVPLERRAMRARLTSRLRALLALDATHEPGQRQLLPQHLHHLVGFSFTPAAPLPPALASGCRLTVSTTHELTFTLPALTPDLLPQAPAGATHCQPVVGIALLDFPAATAHPIR
ncbi:MAG TPA: hypothetical protein VEI97_11320, partial [bacterium]|nr:hypothetical protein [bacterium]